MAEVIAAKKCSGSLYVTTEGRRNDGNRVNGGGCGFDCTVETRFACRTAMC